MAPSIAAKKFANNRRIQDSRLNIRILAVLTYGMLLSHAVYAQQVPTDDPFSEARIRLGIVALEPRVSIRNLGIDTNVFNSGVSEARDFTFTLVPGTQLWMRTGKGLLSLTGDLAFTYFNEFSSERSINSTASAQYEFRFNRLRPYISAATVNTRERPGYEIDARARHYETEFHVGTDLRVASKSTLRLDYRILDYRFDGDEVFNGRALNFELNRRLQATDLAWRQRLTVLTTFVARVTRESERFQFENVRNSNSFRVTSGFELGRFALIRGSAFVGYRKLDSAAGGILPDFSGVTTDVDVSYTLPTQTRLSAAVNRDIDHSYERETPYYILTSWTTTLTQRVIGRWDLQISGGRDRLSYQAIERANQRQEFVGRFGGGIGYQVGEAVRLAFDVQSFYRTSDTPSRQYGSVRAGMSVTYGY